MSRNSVLLGQYIKGRSYLHKRDPRGKFAMAFLSLVVLLCVSSLWSFLLIAGCYFLLAFLTKISIFMLLRSARPIIFLAIFTFLMHCLWSDGVILSAPGALKGLFFALRIIFMALFAGLFTATTTPEKIADSITYMLKPFSRFFDVQSFATIISMSLRFIPIIVLETKKLMFAQASRGVDFKAKKLKDKFHAYTSVLAPEFLLLFSHADKLALAMESRGYVPGAKRTSLHPLVWCREDTVFLLLIFFVSICLLICDRLWLA